MQSRSLSAAQLHVKLIPCGLLLTTMIYWHQLCAIIIERPALCFLLLITIHANSIMMVCCFEQSHSLPICLTLYHSLPFWPTTLWLFIVPHIIIILFFMVLLTLHAIKLLPFKFVYYWLQTDQYLLSKSDGFGVTRFKSSNSIERGAPKTIFQYWWS